MRPSRSCAGWTATGSSASGTHGDAATGSLAADRRNPQALEAVYKNLYSNARLKLSDLLRGVAGLLPEKAAEALAGTAFHSLDDIEQKAVQALALCGKPVPEAAIDQMLEPYLGGIPLGQTFDRLIRLYYVRPADGGYALGIGRSPRHLQATIEAPLGAVHVAPRRARAGCSCHATRSRRPAARWDHHGRNQDDSCSNHADTVDPVMPTRIAISDPLPVFRGGIVATLGDIGFAAESPQDLLAWVPPGAASGRGAELQSAEDWNLVAALRQARADLVVVGVLTDVQVSTYVRAVRAGVAAVPRDAPPDAMKRVLQAAAEARACSRSRSSRRWRPDSRRRAKARARTRAPAALGRRDRWLRELAAGVTVARLAEQAGYSERVMFRLLRDLYARMQVRNRTEALLRVRTRLGVAGQSPAVAQAARPGCPEEGRVDERPPRVAERRQAARVDRGQGEDAAEHQPGARPTRPAIHPTSTLPIGEEERS